MKKYSAMVGAGVMSCGALVLAGEQAGTDGRSAGYVTAGEVNATSLGLHPTLTDDEPLRVIEAGPYRLGVFVVGRPAVTGLPQRTASGAMKVTEGLSLDTVASIIQIREGVGTLVTGGQLEDVTRLGADDPDFEVVGMGLRGKAIARGTSRRVQAGDIVLIPAGTAHGFSQVERPLNYLVIRVDSAKAIPLK
jgi:hypothetical protein